MNEWSFEEQIEQSQAVHARNLFLDAMLMLFAEFENRSRGRGRLLGGLEEWPS